MKSSFIQCLVQQRAFLLVGLTPFFSLFAFSDFYTNRIPKKYQQNTNRKHTKQFPKFSQKIKREKNSLRPSAFFSESDIAIVKLMSHLNFYDRVQPACLPDPFHTYDGDSIAVVSGWGTTNPSTVYCSFSI